mgnify:CR=1 FL=1
MKKLAALLLLLGALLALAACGYPVKPENSGTPDAAVTTVKPDSGYTLGGADVVQLNGFRSIDIEWISGSVSVELYDGEGIELSETMIDGGDVSLRMEWRVDEDDSTLDILSQPLTVSASEKKHLTVKLPRSMVLHELDIHTVSADVSVDLTQEDTLTLQELDVSSVSGNVSVNAANAGEISLSTTSGAVSGSVRTGKLEADTVSCKVYLTLDILPTELDIETSSGPVTLAIPTGKTTSVLSVELRTTSGQFSSDVPVTHTKDAPWEFQTVSGDVTITTVK